MLSQFRRELYVTHIATLLFQPILQLVLQDGLEQSDINVSLTMCVDRYMFLCDDWLATNKSDANIRRTLKPSNAFTAANNSSALVRSNIFHKTVDDHMWLSVGMRAKPSSFTRAQRLGTCMATLFLIPIPFIFGEYRPRRLTSSRTLSGDRNFGPMRFY